MAIQFDEILARIGEFGIYQKRTYAFLSVPAVSVGSFMMMLIVVMYTPEHRCKIPSLVNDTYAIQSAEHERIVNETIPDNHDPMLIYDKCHVYVRPDQNTTSKSNFDNATLVKCSEWVYDKSTFTKTFTSQFNLVCDDALKTSHAQMFFFFGVLVGDLVLGLLSDAIGRLKSMCLAYVILLICSVSVSFVPEFFSFAVLEFLVGGCSHGAFMCISVLGMEMVGPLKRLWTGMLQQVFFAVGVCYLALMGYLARNWVWINLACAIPCVFFLSFYWIIPESPRWLISKDRKEEAMVIIRKTAKVNKAHVSESMFDVKQIEVEKTATDGRLWHLFISPVLRRRILILCLNWMVVSMTYYGVTMNSGNMGGSFFLNFFLMGLAEIPGIFIGMALIDKTGRRWSNAGTMIVGGLACVATIPVVLLGGDNLQPLAVTLALIGKCSAAAAFAIVYMFTAEISPTVIRNAAMGLCSCAARVGGMLAPYIAKSGEIIGGKFGVIEPLLVFGVLSIGAGLCLFLLPETLNQKLPDTIQEGEQFGRKVEPDMKEIEIPFIANNKETQNK